MLLQKAKIIRSRVSEPVTRVQSKSAQRNGKRFEPEIPASSLPGTASKTPTSRGAKARALLAARAMQYKEAHASMDVSSHRDVAPIVSLPKLKQESRLRSVDFGEDRFSVASAGVSVSPIKGPARNYSRFGNSRKNQESVGMSRVFGGLGQRYE